MESTINKYSKQLIIFNSIFIFCWLVLSIFPFLWTFWGSFKVKADFFSRADWWDAISGINNCLNLIDYRREVLVYVVALKVQLVHNQLIQCLYLLHNGMNLTIYQI